MRRADGWILALALAALLLCGAMFRYAGRWEEIAPLARRTTISEGTLAEGGYLIDINAAGASLLTTLPGIGEALAERIIAYRQEHGPFATVEALTEVPGIGEGRLEGLRRFVTAG